MLTARLRGMFPSLMLPSQWILTPEYAPPRTGRAQAVHRGKRGTQWQAARDGHWLGCWRGVPSFYASDHVLTRASASHGMGAVITSSASR